MSMPTRLWLLQRSGQPLHKQGIGLSVGLGDGFVARFAFHLEVLFIDGKDDLRGLLGGRDGDL